MNCEQFWDGMPELEAERAVLDRHASECPACAARMARVNRLSGSLRLLAQELGEVDTPARVEANLTAAFREIHGARVAGPAAWWRVPALPWAAAAVVAAVLACGFWLAPKRAAAPPNAHHSRSSQVELATFTNQDLDDGFIPIPDAPQIDPNDDVNVVRMELPRSELLAVGLNVDPSQVSDTVEAEVMLGSDGLARAVRFME
jgi:anti-sigma factor RsiW